MKNCVISIADQNNIEYRFYGVAVSTADSESADPGSNPGRTLLSYYITMFFLIYPQCSSSFILSRQLA